jgi:antitoxin component YwqK of YwqJK toxin-antitoxin module
MKRLILILFFLFSIAACAQKLPDYGMNKVRIAETDKTILAEIYPLTANASIKPNLFYYWYGANLIHATEGGYSGRLLNGQYTEYYLNKNLKEQGTFKNGLKNGIWNSWNDDGTLQIVHTWHNGVMVTGKQASFWKKLYLFKRRKNHTAPDTGKTTSKI